MPPKKSIKFVLPEEIRESSTENRTFRNSLHPGQDEDEPQPKSRTFRKSKYPGQNEEETRDEDEPQPKPRTFRKSKYPGQNKDEMDRKSRISSIVSSRSRYSTRLTQMFTNINIRRDRQSIVARPIEIFLPTFRMESKKPFDPRIVQDFLQSRIKGRLDEHERFKFDDSKSMHSLTRSLSEEILNHVKSFEFDRYKIFVAVTIGEKRYQGFSKSVGVLWDVEIDSMASYVYERNNVYGLVNVFGVYFD